MKFDLFNENTWQAKEVINPNIILTNKAIGAMGQKISEIRNLKNEIETMHSIMKSDEFECAKYLKTNNPDAFKLMEAIEEYPDRKIQDVISSIDQILDMWKDADTRAVQWKYIASLFKSLQPYLKDRSYLNKEAVQKLTSVKVAGNKAWDAYFLVWRATYGENNMARYWEDKYKSTQEYKFQESLDRDDAIPDSS